MQTCSLCNAISPDQARHCVHCQADLSEHSATAAALKRMQANPRVTAVRISVAHDACPYCYELLCTYPKDQAPPLPHQGCSHENGCRCFYEPIINEAALISKLVS
jgi:hypothetical protein